jgi:hypothetical protein
MTYCRRRAINNAYIRERELRPFVEKLRDAAAR